MSSGTRTRHPGRYLLALLAGLLVWMVISWMLRDDEPLVIGSDVVERLAPGQMVPLDLTLTNPRGFPLSVSHLRVSVGTVHAPQGGRSTPVHTR